MWKSMRAAWQPMFHSGSLAAFASTMAKSADALVRLLAAREADGKALDIVQACSEMALEVVGQTAYGCAQLPQQT